VCNRTLSLYYVCTRRSGIILIPWATSVPNLVSFAASTAELDRGEKLCTQSITQSLSHSPSLFHVPETEEAFALEYAETIAIPSDKVAQWSRPLVMG